MKKRFPISVLLSILITMLMAFQYRSTPQPQILEGAWHMKKGNTEDVLVYKDGYFVHTVFNKVDKKFVFTTGGSYREKNGQLICRIEFDTKKELNVGTEERIGFVIAGDKMTITETGGIKRELKRLDAGTGELAGNWRITGRMTDGTINEMPRRDRKTLKLLSGTRFQWMAINPATKEFFGTGGGTYTFIDGKFTEHIEFFSRDSSRVGASLTFDGSVKDGVWNHSGKNSKGEPLNEFWTREK